MARRSAEGTDTNEIYRHAIEAVGAKRLAPALGLSLSHLYRLQRPTMDAEPDGTGARSDLDRVETMVDLLAARPSGRPVLVEMHGWFDALFDRALGAWGGDRLTPDRFHAQVGRAVKEVGEVIARCQDEALGCDELRRGLRREIQEAVAELSALDAALGQTETVSVRRLG